MVLSFIMKPLGLWRDIQEEFLDVNNLGKKKALKKMLTFVSKTSMEAQKWWQQ